MADKKITELPFITDITASVGVSPANTTVIPVVLYGTTNQITADNLKDNFIREVRRNVADIQSYTSSLKGAVTVRGNGIEVAGNLEVDGNLSVKGTIYTQYETSSVIYSSGSTKFGNSFDDLHEFTGSSVFTGSYTINGQDYTFYSSSNSTLFTNFSSSNSSYNTTFSSSNSTYITALSSSNSSYNTNLSSSNSTLFTNFSSSNSTVFTSFSSSDSTKYTNFSSSNSTLFTNFSSSNSSYNTNLSSSNSTVFTNFSSSNSSYNTTFSSSNSTTFTNYSSSTANSIAGLSSGVSSELARVYQTTSSLNIFTGSQDSRNFVISQYTSSTDAHIVGISSFTSSQLAVNLGNAVFTSSARIELNSIESYTASLKTAAIVSSSTQIQNYDVFALNSRLYNGTGSLQAQLNGLMAFTAALDNTYATDAQLFQLYQATRSLELLSGSTIGITNGLMAFTSSARIELNSLEAYTASLKSAAIVSSSTQITNYYKFAETSSANTFYGNQTFNSNVQANKFVFTDGIVNDNVGGQKIIGTSGNILYLYTGTSGLYINNQANSANNVTITDSGVIQTRGKLTVGAPGNDQDIAFGGSNSKLDWAGTGAQIGYNVGALQFSSVGTTNNMILQQQAGAVFNAGITGSLMATNNVVSSSNQIPELFRLMQATASLNSYTGSSIGIDGGLMAYTASLKAAAIVSSSTQILNYNLFALTASNNTFYGTQKLTGSFDITGSVRVSGNEDSGFYYNGNKQFNKGQWFNTQTMSGSANTAYPMWYDTTDTNVTNNSVYLAEGSKLYVKNTGVYNIEFSAQLGTTTNETVDFSIWFAITGSNVAYSNTDVSLVKSGGVGGKGIAAWNYMTYLSSGSYVEIYYSKNTANGQIQAVGTQTTPTRPATPSVITTVTQHG